MGEDAENSLFKKTYIRVAERYGSDPIFRQTYLKLGERYVCAGDIFKEEPFSAEEKGSGPKKTFKLTRKGD